MQDVRLISLRQYQALYNYLERHTRYTACAGGLEIARHWLYEYASIDSADASLRRIIAMGGRCDCSIVKQVKPYRWYRHGITCLSAYEIDLCPPVFGYRDEWTKFLTLLASGCIVNHL